MAYAKNARQLPFSIRCTPDTGALRYWHFALGAAVALIAAPALWQDWKLSDKELALHGQ
jgi:hypothetical protein